MLQEPVFKGLCAQPCGLSSRCLDFVALGLGLQHRAVKGTHAGPTREAPSRTCHHTEGGVPSCHPALWTCQVSTLLG